MLALITPGVRSNLYWFARRIVKNPEAAETILVDSITKAIERVDPARITKFLAYLKMVIRNQSLDWLKKSVKQRTYLKRASTHLTTRSAFAEAISREALKVFDEVVLRLTRRERRAFLMRVIDRLSFEKIAKRLKTTSTNAKTIVFRARQRLQGWMGYLRAL
jgi:RNA polymerase sigma factor (sigma-70 family)